MKLIMFVVIYLIGVVISSIIFSRFFFKYNDPKDCFGLTKPDVKYEQEHYAWIALISWFYPIAWIVIIIHIICNVSIDFVKYISKL